MFKYFAYGLGIHSEFPIPDFREAEAPCDVEVRLAPENLWFQSPIPTPYAELGKDVTTIGFEPVVFRLRGGQEITVTPVVGADLALIRLYLVGKVMATLLYQRGLLVLHASSIEVNGQAVAFVGESGVGKSSLAASLHAVGHRFVADDVTAVDLLPGLPMAIPAFPQLKIDPAVAGSLGYDTESMTCLHPMEVKHGLRVEDRFAGRPLPLGMIYLLEGDSGTSKFLSPQEILVELVRHSFPARLRQSGGAPHLLQCANLARQVRIVRLLRSESRQKASELTSRIQKDLTANGDVASSGANVAAEPLEVALARS